MPEFKRQSFSYFLTTLLLYFLSIPFIRTVPLRVFACMLLAFPVLMSVRRYYLSRSVMLAREELKSLMECLCNAVASGRILTNAFIDAADELVLLYGHRSYTVIALKRFEEKIRLGTSFCDALAGMASEIRCPEAVPLFDALSRSDLLGSKVLLILRHNLTMVSELLSVSRDISSDVSQKRLEGTIMAGMPFLVIWSLNLSAADYIASAFMKPIGSYLFLFAFCMSVFAYCISMHIISGSVHGNPARKNVQPPRSIIALLSTVYSSVVSRIAGLARFFSRLAGFLPADFLLSRKRLLIHLNPEKDDPVAEYLFIKFFLLLIALLFCAITLLFIGFIPAIWIILPGGLLIMHDVDLQIRISSGKNRLMRDFPGFIGLLSTLLSNGIVLSNSIRICIDTFTVSSAEFRKELSILKGAIYSGTPVSEALDNLAVRSGTAAVSGALLLAAQYGRNGSAETLSMLGLQANACWAQSRTAARRQLDESSVKLLLPMMIQLICVMLISVLPSLISIGISG